MRFRRVLDLVRGELGCNLVAYEAVTYTGPRMRGAGFQSELIGVMKIWCMENGVEFTSRNLTSIKRHATGRGNASKSMMRKAAVDAWTDKDVTDHNEADALWLLDLVQQEL